MNKSTTYIYALCNPITDEIRYIGKSNNPQKRLDFGHLKPRGKYGNKHLKNWISSLDKKGDKPKLTMIDEVFISEWEFWERHYISLYKSFGCNLLNICKGGWQPPSRKGCKLNEHQKKAILKANTGIKRSKETKKKMSEWQIGRKLPESTKKKISETRKKRKIPSWCKGKTGIFSKEVLQKMSLAKKGMYDGEKNPMYGKRHSNETINKIKKKLEHQNIRVCQLDLGGNFIKEWKSMTEASLELKIDKTSISRACSGIQGMAGMFKWQKVS